MFGINRQHIENETKKTNSKTTLGKENSLVFPVFKQKIWNLIDTVSSFSVYEMAHWICNTDRWIRNRTSTNTKAYKRGQILFVDLGASNFKFEPSFTHPCIVLINRRDSMLVVPCSSKKYGKGFREIIDAQPSDGFRYNTGIQMESMRWINKNRVVDDFNSQVSFDILNKIDEYILGQTPLYRKENKAWTYQKKALEDQIKSQKEELEQQIQLLKQELASHKEKGA